MDSIILWNEKLQKKMLGTKINNDETEMIKNIISNTTQPGIQLLVFQFSPSLLLSTCWKKLSKYCETLWTTLKLFSETHA